MTRSVTVCVVALVAVGLAGAITLGAAVVEATERVEPAARANARILQLMTDSETAVRGYQLTHQADFLAPLTAAGPGLRESTTTLASLTASRPAISADVSRQEQLVQAWEIRYAQPVLAGRRQDLSESELVSARAEFDQIRAVNSRIGDWSEGRRHSLALLAVITAVVSGLALFVAGAIALTIGLRPARRALSSVVPPLEALQGVVGQLHARDFSARADPAAGMIEIQAVARALNELAAGQQEAESKASEELRLTALERDWGSAAHSLVDVERIVRDALVPLRRGMDAPVIWIRIFEGAGDRPGKSTMVMHPPTDWLASPPGTVELARQLAERCWRLQQPVTMHTGPSSGELDVEAHIRASFLAAARQVGADSLMFTGLGVGDIALGYLAFGRGADNPDWSPLELRTMQRMAREIGLAVANARTFEHEQRLVAELKALDASKNSFVSTVSHELRTPLASVIGHLEVVRSRDLSRLDPSILRSLDAMDRNTQRLAGLVENLLLLSQVQEKSPGAQLVDIRDVIEHCLTTVRPTADREAVGIDFEPPGELPAVRGDVDELERVVDNLMANAIKFSPAGSRVELAVTMQDRQAVAEGHRPELLISVCDYGLGISRADQKTLFTRFFRSTNPEAQAIPGTGLGLSICKVIIDRHGGSIEVDSELGRGTKITVRLPTVAAESISA